MGLGSQLQKIKKDGLTVSQHLAQIKDASDKFSAIGEPLSYRDHLGYILDGLENEYNLFVTSIQNHTDWPLLADVCSLLLAYEARLEKQIAVDKLNLVQVNVAQMTLNQNPKRLNWHSNGKSSSSKFSMLPNSNPRIFNPPNSSPPFNQPRPNFRPNSRPDRPQYQICTKFGHIALVCHNRHNPFYQVAPQSSSVVRPQAHLN